VIALRRLRIGATWTALGLLLGVLLAIVAPLAGGDRSFTVLSGSMSPAIDTGDVVVTEPIAPAQAQVGDVVTFTDPEGTGKLFSHRVQSVHSGGGQVHFVTRGDANTSTERWNVAADGTVGRVLYRVPKVGWVLAWAGTGPGRIGLLVLPALALCALGLARIWRREDGAGVSA
jgi:signal peptidase I